MAEFEIGGLALAVPDEMLNERIATKLKTGRYEGHEANAVRMRLKPGMPVLELGAGIGYIGSICASVVGAENVVSVEANPALIDVIRANFDRNGFAEISLLHGAVTGLDGLEETLAFDPRKTFWAGRIADESASPDQLVEVPQIGLPDLLERHQPRMVVMDVEGAEQYLFDAPWPRYVHHVIMELHPRQYPDIVIKRIVDCMSASGLTYDPGPSQGRILAFRRIRATNG